MIEYLFHFTIRGGDGRWRSGRVRVRAGSEREADVKAAEQLSRAGAMQRGDEVRLRCLERS